MVFFLNILLRGSFPSQHIEPHELNHVVAGKGQIFYSTKGEICSQSFFWRSGLAGGWASPWSHCLGLTARALPACGLYPGHDAWPSAGQGCGAGTAGRATGENWLCVSFLMYRTWEVCKEQSHKFFFPPAHRLCIHWSPACCVSVRNSFF